MNFFPSLGSLLTLYIYMSPKELSVAKVIKRHCGLSMESLVGWRTLNMESYMGYQDGENIISGRTGISTVSLRYSRLSSSGYYLAHFILEVYWGDFASTGYL